MFQFGPLLAQDFAFTTPQQAFASLLAAFYALTAIAAFFYILWGGIRYITSGGDEKKTAGARQTIINAIVGLILLGLAGVFWQFLVETLLPDLVPYYNFQ